MPKFCILWVSSLAILLPISQTTAEQVYISHCLEECPAHQNRASELVVRHLFVASIDDNSGVADWVAYKVLPETVGVASLLPRFWQIEDLNQAQSPYEALVYRSSGISQPDLSGEQDRDYRVNELAVEAGDVGRLVPMSSFAGTPFWSELNFLSNLAALPYELRFGSWSRLDQAINEATSALGELYVISGPLYAADSIVNADGQALLRKPIAYFKVIANDKMQASFVFDKDLQQHVNHCDQLSNLEEVRRRSQLNMLNEVEIISSTELLVTLGC